MLIYPMQSICVYLKIKKAQQIAALIDIARPVTYSHPLNQA